ncbi:flagellar filament capping protein FliD [Paenibacillus ihbetae]|uniref:flagellar filament capping protein FliD n=1 Tax=Paenibacillus ihbetae TaxID=1870820 RepID=UPI000C150081|nr:flagellar filament capping protein FliD [Paenibacillus ihbetae]
MSNISSLYNPIRYTGLGSGMDIDSIVKSLMDVERLPLQKLTRQRTSLIWQREDYRSMNTALSSFRSAAEKLRLSSGFESSQVTSSNPAAVEVSGSNSAGAGYNSIKVLNLATSASITGQALPIGTKPEDVVGVNGTFEITGPKGTSSPINITSGTSTISSIISDINAQSYMTGVKANYDANTRRIFLTTDTTGAESKISINDNDGALEEIFKLSALSAEGKNAKFEYNDVNGLDNYLESATNNFTLNGLTFTLKAPTSEAVSIMVTKSNNTAVENIKEFVNQYNNIIDKFMGATSTRPDKNYQPLLDEEKEAMKDSQIEKWESKARQGSLYNDSILKGALDDFRKAFREPVTVGQKSDGSDDKRLLSSIGITVMMDPKQNGKLQIDEEKLKSALASDPEAVKNIFMKLPSESAKADPQKRFEGMGFAERLYESINNQISKINKKIGFGSAESIDDSVLGEQLKQLNARAITLQDRITMIENRYYKKFTAMETALQSLNNKGSWISSQLSSL